MELPIEDFTSKIYNQQIDFFTQKKEEALVELAALEQEIESEDLGIDALKKANDLRLVKFNLFFYEKEIEKATYDLFLNRKRNNRQEPFMLTVYQ